MGPSPNHNGSDMTVFLFLAGIGLLIFGAELLIKGASRMAAALGISPLVIGLTVVAFGTSSPELAVSIKSAFTGQAALALGNVIGSNIFNILLILGLSALIVPLVVSQQLVRLDVPVMIILSVLVLLLALDGNIGRLDGLFLIIGLAVYLIFLFHASRKETTAAQQETATPSAAPGRRSWLRNLVLACGGLAMLVLGSRWLVASAVIFAEYLGVSELIIGLTIVAAGTSLPEVVTSVVAARRGERDIAVGNVVGSNILNIVAVLGITALIAPHGIAVAPSVIRFDIPVMIAVAFACLPIFFTDGVISRLEGMLLLGYYIVYTLYLALDATQHDALPGFSAVMLEFVIPLTALTLVIVFLQEVRKRRRG